MRKSSGALHLADDRIKRAVGVLRRAEVAQARVWLGSETFQQRRRQSRLADARLTGEQHHLAFAGLCLRPAPQQQFEFFFPPDKFRQAARVESLEAAFHRSRSQRRPGSHRPRDALEVLCPKVLKLEQIAHELAGAFGNHDAVRLRNALQARRKVRRLAYDGLLLRSARPDQVADDHQSGCDADARLQGRVGLQSTHSSDQLQPRAHGSLCVVLVGLRITEVDQHPIAHVLRYEAAEALHGLRDALLVGRDDLAEVFRVHAGRERR